MFSKQGWKSESYDRSTRGRGWLLVVALVGLLIATAIPAGGAPGGPNVKNAPTDKGIVAATVVHEDAHCPAVNSEASFEFRIVNPVVGDFTDTANPESDDPVFTLTNVDADYTFDWSVSGDWAVYDVVVKGGEDASHFDYEDSTFGPQTSDGNLHPPGKKVNQYFPRSHVTFCYSRPPAITLSGTVFHDTDYDQTFDSAAGTVETGMANRPVNLYRGGTLHRTTTSDAAGAYSFTVSAGSYVVCVELPAAITEDGIVKSWALSTPTGNTDCPGGLAGHTDNFTADTSGLDFGAAQEWTIPAGGTATQGDDIDDGVPHSTIDLSGCDKDVTAVFEVGVNNDAGDTQFVVFVVDALGDCIVEQTIVWNDYPAVYNASGQLIIPATKVVYAAPPAISVTGTCGEGEPNDTKTDCRASREVLEGGDVPVGKIRETEVWKFLVDPTRAR